MVNLPKSVEEQEINLLPGLRVHELSLRRTLFLPSFDGLTDEFVHGFRIRCWGLIHRDRQQTQPLALRVFVATNAAQSPAPDLVPAESREKPH